MEVRLAAVVEVGDRALTGQRDHVGIFGESEAVALVLAGAHIWHVGSLNAGNEVFWVHGEARR